MNLLLLAPVLLLLPAVAGNCECSGASGRVKGHGVRCASWDAPDEKPWCYVDEGACGDSTFEGNPGDFWSHVPCKDVAGGKVPAAAAATAGTTTAKKGRVAIAITLTKDGSGSDYYLDGAAVLKQSMEQTNSAWDVDFIAIVHPSVKTARAPLVKLGYKIYEKKWPFDSSGIQKAHLRETIDKSGCCGMAELIKLSAWEMVQYHRVMLLDSDSLVLHNVDELFDTTWDFLFTYDRNMDGSWSSHPPVQGGFFVLKPDLARYKQLEDTVREGDFREGSGWGGENVGWCYGGQTIQGLLSYYANFMRPVSESKEMDSAIYNNMASNVNAKGRKQNTVPASEIKIGHFTTCQKPWKVCYKSAPTCQGMFDHWWQARRALETKHGMKPTARCANGAYAPIKMDEL